jgi:L-amino acid N-acyltransferase YncA
VNVREACREDIDSIRLIYNQGIEDRIATLDEDAKSAADIEAWWADHDDRYAVIVALENGAVVGWASLNRYSPRRAYQAVAEISIYVERECRGRGIGALLLTELERVAALNGFHKLVLFALPFNTLGQNLYRACGFREVGAFHEHGRINGRYVDVTAMEKVLADPSPGGTSRTS